MSPEQIVRLCAHVVGIATGVDPHDRRRERKGDAQLQIARKLWVQMVVIECGINRVQAARLCDRARETIDDDLREIDAWRDQAALDESLERYGEAVRALIEHAHAIASSLPSPRDRYRMRAIAMGA